MKDVILVGVDGSPGSIRALDWAIAEARTRNWPIRLVTSVSPAFVADPLVEASYLKSAEREAKTILNEAQERANVHGVHAEMLALVGDAGGVLVEQSQAAGLAVVGKRGRGGFAGRLLGSVSSGLAAHSKCPTVVVPEESKTDATSGSGSQGDTTEDSGSGTERTATETLSFSGHVVIAVDFGPEDPTLREGTEVAKRHGKPLTLLMVSASILGDAWTLAGHAAEEYHQAATRELDRVLAAVRADSPVLAVDGHVVVGEPAAILISVTRTADLLVLGTRGHSGFPGLLLGSVSQAVLHHGHSPMMVVPRSWGAAGDAPDAD